MPVSTISRTTKPLKTKNKSAFVDGMAQNLIVGSCGDFSTKTCLNLGPIIVLYIDTFKNVVNTYRLTPLYKTQTAIRDWLSEIRKEGM